MEPAYLRALEAPSEVLALISREQIDRACAYARQSPRRRVIQPLHRDPGDSVHRMLNAVQPGSYVRPHRHADPPKAEAWIVLRGAAAFFCFDEEGRVTHALRIAAGSECAGVDLVAGPYHGFAALEPDTVIYEVKTGPYVAATDKEFAPWAPEEGSPAAPIYLEELLRAFARSASPREGLANVRWRPPLLRTPRLLLRGFEPGDADAIFAYASDEETTRYMAWDRHVSSAASRGFLDGFIAASYRRHGLDYAICLASDPGRVIGSLGVYPRGHRTWEIGYILAKPHWGQGLGPEAVGRLIDHAFESTDGERIQAPIFAENQRSRKLAARLGMQLDGVLRSALELRGRRWDEAIYSILRADWQRTAERDARH